MAQADSNNSTIVQISDYRPPVSKRAKVQPFHKKYPMPFFKPRKSSGINAWKVSPSGDYGEDCKMGSAFAIQFLKSCDKTYGWQSLLQCIVADMIREGTDGEFPNGFPTVNGVVIGFMSVIGSAVAYSRVLEQVGTRDGQQGGQD